MLPDNYHPDDKKWIKSKIDALPVDKKLIALKGYNKAYLEALNNCDCEIKRHNQARRAANLRLLRFYDKSSQSADVIPLATQCAPSDVR